MYTNTSAASSEDLTSVCIDVHTQRIITKILLKRALKSINWDRGQCNPSLIKKGMENLDSAFDVRELGYSCFSQFLRASGLVSISAEKTGKQEVRLLSDKIIISDNEAFLLREQPLNRALRRRQGWVSKLKLLSDSKLVQNCEVLDSMDSDVVLSRENGSKCLHIKERVTGTTMN